MTIASHRSQGARTLGALVSVLLLLLTVVSPALASAIEVTSPKGLTVWLAEDHTSPLLTLGFRFAGGSAQDPPGKEGLAHMAGEMFFQGAGNQQADDYLQSWNELGAEVTVDARVESLRGTLKVLTRDRDKAVRLLARELKPKPHKHHRVGCQRDHRRDSPAAIIRSAWS